jgi:hypothetical protein
MKKTVTINGHKHEFQFDLDNDHAVNGRFNGAEGPELIHDLVAEYGPDATVRSIAKKLCDRVQLYHVTINETVCKDFTYAVYGIDADDAKDEALTGNGELLTEHEIDTDFEVVDCMVAEEDTDD